jgi:uncharacterized protein
MGSAVNVTRDSVVAVELEPARSFWQKFMGLMGRPSLAPSAGLWLPGTNNIHMMFMRFPIDCVFLSRPGPDGRRVVSVRRALRPWTGVVWYARGADGVLELPVGTLDASRTSIGDTVRLEGLD